MHSPAADGGAHSSVRSARRTEPGPINPGAASPSAPRTPATQTGVPGPEVAGSSRTVTSTWWTRRAARPLGPRWRAAAGPLRPPGGRGTVPDGAPRDPRSAVGQRAAPSQPAWISPRVSPSSPIRTRLPRSRACRAARTTESGLLAGSLARGPDDGPGPWGGCPLTKRENAGQRCSFLHQPSRPTRRPSTP